MTIGFSSTHNHTSLNFSLGKQTPNQTRFNVLNLLTNLKKFRNNLELKI